MVYKCFDKKFLVVLLKMKILLIINLPKNYTPQLLENLIKEKYIHLLLGHRFSRYAIEDI